MHKLFTVCTEQLRSPYTEHAASGLPNPTHLEGEVRFDQAQDLQVVTTRSPRIVTECLLNGSMLIKMYVYAIYSWFSHRNYFVYQKAWIWVYHYTITIEFDESICKIEGKEITQIIKLTMALKRRWLGASFSLSRSLDLYSGTLCFKSFCDIPYNQMRISFVCCFCFGFKSFTVFLRFYQHRFL